jgi:NitT/TauT family transport system permease protein
MPALIWNMMVSMSGSWFFVVAAEAISVGNTTITLRGIGSYIASAIAARDLHAIYCAIGAMLVVILIYDQLLFRPLVAWADRFRFDQEQNEEPPESWALTVFRRSRLMSRIGEPFGALARWTYQLKPAKTGAAPSTEAQKSTILVDLAWNALLILLAGYALWRAFNFEIGVLKLADLLTAVELGLFTLLRVVVLIALASLIWTPIGVLVGLNHQVARFVQPIAQFFAAFPANLLFPVAVYLIVNFKLDPDIWLSPLMVLGTQWYILFNVIAGASVLPRELRDAARNNDVKGLLWWRRVALPGVFPYYVTGAITASGGSWNASIVAELVTWGNHTIHAHGLGEYIGRATAAGDFHRIVLGIVIMSVLVTALNRVFWRPLYAYAERRFKLT